MLLDTNLFILQDVLGDNNCFYRAIINELVWRSKIDKLDNDDPTKLFKQKYFNSKNSYLDIKKYCNDNYQSTLIKTLKLKINKYLKKNRQLIIPELDINIGSLVSITHDMSIEQYLNVEVNLWAGLLEQIIVSNLFRVPIIILKAYSKNGGKLCEGIIKNSKPNKNVKYKVIQIIYPIHSIKGLPIYLLWKKYSNGIDHYMSIYLNDLDMDSDILFSSSSL